MNKVSPVLINIVNDFDLTTGQSGLLISIFSLAGIFLSIPMGMLITRYGSFKTGLISLVAIIAGSSMGAIATSYSILLVSRGIEGIGLLFLATIGPAAVANAFSDEKRGTAMGLLMCYMSFGQILALNLAPIMGNLPPYSEFVKYGGGDACIIGPNGKILTEKLPRNAEGIVYADIDLQKIVDCKYQIDPAGHYSNKSLTMTFNRRPQPVVNIVGDDPTSPIKYDELQTEE